MKYDSRLIKIVRSIVTIGLLIYGGYYVYSHRETFHNIQQINWKILCIMAVFIVFNIFASATENAYLYRAIGAPIGSIESFGLTNVSSFFNLIFPQGGTITKAIYLKQRYKIPYSKTPAIYLGLLVIFFLIGAGVILISNLVTLTLGGTVPLILWIAVAFALASSVLFMIDFPKDSLHKLGKISTILSNYAEGWKALRTNRTCLINACIWQFIIFVSSGIWVSAAYYSLGIKINPLLGISLSILVSFSNILIIVPGNLGIQEAVYGYFTYLTGMTFAEGVVVSAVVRAVLLSITLGLAPFSWYFLFYKRNINLPKEKFIEKQ